MLAEAPLVEVDGLHVVSGRTQIVRDVSFSIARGEVLALIGESGSGKTTIGLALMGYARRGCRIAEGRIRVGDIDVRSLSHAALSGLRGRTVSYVAQSAAASFNPAHRLMPQVIESALIHRLMPRADAEAKARTLFADLALPDPDRIGDRFPHQVSGGQLQRLLAAMALITDPDLVILDEPTTALDVTTQIEVLRAFRQVVRGRRTTALYVSHDLSVVAQMADRVVVLRDGEVQEMAATQQLLDAPVHPYTRSLLAAVAPVARVVERQQQAEPPPLLRINGLVAGYGPADVHGLPEITVLRDIDLGIESDSVLGVIGESGCGKSTLAQVIAGLIPPARGSIELDGVPLPRSPRSAPGSSFAVSRSCFSRRMSHSTRLILSRTAWRGRCASTTQCAAKRCSAVLLHCSTWCICLPLWRTTIRKNCRVGKSSASTSRAHSPPNRA